ncbi:hypothetical protein PQO01_19590 [Lentisphaera marina]|uniref:hypothetical protein n=1 Tax=Lentisphaera marina TaxID=1111041 RepID=UPI0023668D59|nr:hypothetical protein [Lentisphaera marina]MDD7987160.1 hypothetical protein [Lentisphaera marina]
MNNIKLALYLTWTQLPVKILHAFSMVSVLGSIIYPFIVPPGQYKEFFTFHMILTIIGITFTFFYVWLTVKKIHLVKTGDYILGEYDEQGLHFIGSGNYTVKFIFNNCEYKISLDKETDDINLFNRNCYLVVDHQKPTKNFIWLPEEKWKKLKNEKV